MAAETSLTAVLARPDDVGAWTVHGDALQVSGDTRGPLVALMLAHEQRPTFAMYESVRAYLEAHVSELAPAAIARAPTTAWRRGYVSAMHLETPDGLAGLLADPALRFVEEVVIDAFGNWPLWRQPLLANPPAWRRVTVRVRRGDGEPRLSVAAIAAAVPAVELLWVSRPAAEPLELVWDGIAASRLRRLVAEGVGEFALDGADLPALVELRLVGHTRPTAQLYESELWPRLERVVIEAPHRAVDVRPGPHVAEVTADWQRNRGTVAPSNEQVANAFIALPGRVELGLLAKLATDAGDVESLSATIAITAWPLPPLTVIELFATGAPELVPYRVANALQRMGKGPVVLFAMAPAEQGAYGVVVDDEHYRRSDQYEAAGAVLRDLFAAAFGVDPGIMALRDVVDALDTAGEVVVLGDVGEQGMRLLNDVDPEIVPPEASDDQDGDDDEYYGEDYLPDDEAEPAADVPFDPVVAPVIERELEVLGVDVAEAALPDLDADVEPRELVELVEPAETADGDDAWLRLADVWDDRLSDPSDECNQLHWQDPELVARELPDVEATAVEPACARCGESRSSVRRCSWCGRPSCAACALEDERGRVYCAVCSDELDASGRA